ncbi:hypothetical protein Btru_012170 [Bulinus truncatus]|nr:hypothetical protein Btru_012170 [Bulinus truncatus]
MLLAFDVNGQTESSLPYDPFNVFNSERTKTTQSALTVTIDSVQSKRHGRDSPAVKVKLDLNSMMSEVDVTIIDRLTNLIHRDPFNGSGTSLGAHLMDTNGQVGIEEAIKDENNGKKLNLDIQAKAVHATLRVRFPIPDLRVDRPSHTRDWWRRNLHKEVLLLKMDSPEAGTNIRTDEPWQLELQIFKITAYLQEDINEEPILFGEVTVEDPKATAHDGHHFNWPRIVINVSNKANSALETEEESDASATSIDSYMEPGMLKRESGPFSKKKSLYERDDLSFNQSNPVNDEMVMPGDTNELRQFREECLAHTGLSVDITIPSVTAFLHSRDFLELIYNRRTLTLLACPIQHLSLDLLLCCRIFMGDLDDKSKTISAHLLHSVKPGNFDQIRNRIPDYLKSKIYRSDRWVSDKSQGRAGWGQDSPDMVTLVVKTKIDTLNNVKNFTLALRVDGATLRHEMHRPGESWISQTIDLFDLKDFPILGYTLPKIMTEIHLQIDHCCVDYRPINLPIWTFLTVEHFNICSNIIAESAFSQIRLSLDDSALFVSKKCNKEVNLLKDYVCIAEIDQFKIWLQFCYDKKGYQRAPKSDLRFMVNELNLYTCADSAKALIDLIHYIVNDGDLEERGDAGDITPTGCEELPPLISNEEPSSSPVLQNITPEQVASVEAALEEAMIDCPETQKIRRQSGKKEKPQRMTTVFFQCDSSKQMPTMRDDIDRALLQITISDSSDSTTPDEEGASGDMEDFEIVDCHFKEVTNIKGSHEVHMLTPKPIEVNENFIMKPTTSYDHLKAPEKFPDPEAQYTLREMSVVWHIYGGSDFSHPHRGSSSERKSHSKGISSPRELRKSESGSKTRRHSWRHRGGDFRDFNVLMELDLNKIRFRYEVYPNHTKQASRFKLLVNNIEVRDRIKSSEVNKLLVKLVDKEHPEQSSAYMLMISGVFTRPEYLPFRKECEVKAFCLPIKLNIDQVSLNFLWKFIAQVSEPEGEILLESGSRSSPLGGRSSPAPSSPRSSITSTDPIMRVGSSSTSETSMDQTELLMKFEDFTNQQSLYLQARLNENLNLEIPEEDLPVFIKSFILISDVTIKLDYRGKRCDMDSGMVGMMLGVASLTGSMVKLKRINCQKGILGWDKLLMYAYSEWLNDIRSNQIHSILKGVGSLSIVFQIVQGVMDLIRLPIEQYQKDRRIIRGLQRGANSFTLNTLMAILELTNKVVGSIQYCAEMGYDMMSPGPSVRRRKQLRQNSRQPRTIAEGAKTALTLVTEGVKESASSLSAIVSEESAHKGYVGVVGGALRNAAPECLFKPLALLAEAGTSIVQGVRNEVDPSKMKEEEDRWK